jgi:hypothetical protein
MTWQWVVVVALLMLTIVALTAISAWKDAAMLRAGRRTIFERPAIERSTEEREEGSTP